MAKEIHKAKEKNKQSLHEQLNEREKLEAVQLQEQHTATELIQEASKKLTEALKDSGKKSASCEGCTGYVNHWE